MFRRILMVLAATAMAAASFAVAPQQAAAAPDVYSTPGTHNVGGRQWQTTCQKYSSTTVRCTTNIWATQIRYEGGAFENVTGWHFNNLTYLPSVRTAWAKNPLGYAGDFTSADRQWQTVCDTPATGRGACRSYIWTHFIATEGGSYVQKAGWVFNNVVLFAEGSVTPVTEIPGQLQLKGSLDIDGYGPLKIGASMDALAQAGYATWTVDGQCGTRWGGTKVVQDHNMALYGEGKGPGGGDTLIALDIMNENIQTTKGIKHGSTLAEVRAAYGIDVTLRGDAGPGIAPFASFKRGNNAIAFFLDIPHGADVMKSPPNTKINGMVVYDFRHEAWLFEAGCMDPEL